MAIQGSRHPPGGSSLIFSRRGIEHICQLNNVPTGVFLPVDNESGKPPGPEALAWTTECNSLTPNRHWHLRPGAFAENQEILVFTEMWHTSCTVALLTRRTGIIL